MPVDVEALLPVGWEAQQYEDWELGLGESILEAILGEVEEEDEGSSSAQVSTVGEEEKQMPTSSTGTNPNAAPWQPCSAVLEHVEDEPLTCNEPTPYEAEVLPEPSYAWAESEAYELLKHLPYPVPIPPEYIAEALSRCSAPDEAHYFLTSELGYAPAVVAFFEAYCNIRWPEPPTSYNHYPHARRARRRVKDPAMTSHMLGYSVAPHSRRVVGYG